MCNEKKKQFNDFFMKIRYVQEWSDTIKNNKNF